MSGVVLERLRAETREDHERVESLVDLMRPDLTAGRYAAWLAAFYGYIDPWEEAIRPVLTGVVPDLDERRKRPLLRADLGRVSPVPPSGIPRCTWLPGLATVPHALGSLYVLEGATLGGRHIARHVGRALGYDAGGGCAYFHGYGERTGSMWRGLGRVLEERSSPVADEAMVAGAKETFATLAAWLAVAVRDRR